jgi:hypothetical protein
MLQFLGFEKKWYDVAQFHGKTVFIEHCMFFWRSFLVVVCEKPLHLSDEVTITFEGSSPPKKGKKKKKT